MATYSYIRESTKDQSERENGLNAQRDAIGTVDREFCEIISGAAGDNAALEEKLEYRPVLMELLNTIQKGDVVRMWRRDRMSRADPVMGALIESTIKRKGATLEFADGSATINYDDPNTVLQVRIMDAFAEYERLITKHRTKAALRSKKERAERTGNAPYGFKPNESTDTKQLEIDDTEQQIVAVVKELRSRGESLQQICYALEIQGFINKRGRTGKWHKQTISNIIKYQYSAAQQRLITQRCAA